MEKAINNSTIASLTSAIFIMLAVRHTNDTFVYISILPAILSLIYLIIGISNYRKASKEIQLDNRNSLVFQCGIFLFLAVIYVGYIMTYL